jgi:hypothetical protein
MTLPDNPTPSESTQKMGVLEGGLLGVIALIGGLITVGGLVIIVAGFLLGNNALDLGH